MKQKEEFIVKLGENIDDLQVKFTFTKNQKFTELEQEVDIFRTKLNILCSNLLCEYNDYTKKNFEYDVKSILIELLE